MGCGVVPGNVCALSACHCGPYSSSTNNPFLIGMIGCYSLGDHPQRATSSVLLDRGDGSGGEKIMDFNLIRLIRQQQRLPGEESVCYSLLPEGRWHKTGQNKTFDPGDSRGHLRACPFLGPWRALVCGEVLRAGAAGDELQRFCSDEIRWLF